MDTIDDVLSSNVMRLRGALNLTQEELASASDLSLRMIQKIEYKQAWPSPATIKKVAKALKVRPSELFTVSDGTSATVESLLDAMTVLQKDYRRLEHAAKGKGNVLESELTLLRAKYSPEAITKLVQAQGDELEMLRSLISGDVSTFYQHLERVIAEREKDEEKSKA